MLALVTGVSSGTVVHPSGAKSYHRSSSRINRILGFFLKTQTTKRMALSSFLSSVIPDSSLLSFPIPPFCHSRRLSPTFVIGDPVLIGNPASLVLR